MSQRYLARHLVVLFVSYAVQLLCIVTLSLSLCSAAIFVGNFREHRDAKPPHRTAPRSESESVAMHCKNKERRNAKSFICIAVLFVFASHCNALTLLCGSATLLLGLHATLSFSFCCVELSHVAAIFPSCRSKLFASCCCRKSAIRLKRECRNIKPLRLRCSESESVATQKFVFASWRLARFMRCMVLAGFALRHGLFLLKCSVFFAMQHFLFCDAVLFVFAMQRFLFCVASHRFFFCGAKLSDFALHRAAISFCSVALCFLCRTALSFCHGIAYRCLGALSSSLPFLEKLDKGALHTFMLAYATANQAIVLGKQSQVLLIATLALRILVQLSQQLGHLTEGIEYNRRLSFLHNEIRLLGAIEEKPFACVTSHRSFFLRCKLFVFAMQRFLFLRRITPLFLFAT